MTVTKLSLWASGHEGAFIALNLFGNGEVQSKT
jgi:hypothetical protein